MKIIERLVLITTFLQTILMWGCEKEEALKCDKVNKEAEIGKIFCIRAKPVVLNPTKFTSFLCEVISPDSLGGCGTFRYGKSNPPDSIKMKNGIFLYSYEKNDIKLEVGKEYNFKIMITKKAATAHFGYLDPPRKLNHASIESVDVCTN